MNISNIFSIFLTTDKIEIDDNELKTLINFVEDLEKNCGVKNSNIGGWQSEGFNYFINNTVEKIFNNIEEGIKLLNNKICLKQDLKLLSYWININKTGHMNMPHIHVGNKDIVSGTIYLKVNEKSGNIVFMNNFEFTGFVYDSKVKNFNEFNSANYTFIPKNKDYILFPSYVKHYVEPNLSNEKRISISFNYGF
jgi:uncharacterized protein (TIGR02466 family)